MKTSAGLQRPAHVGSCRVSWEFLGPQERFATSGVLAFDAPADGVDVSVLDAWRRDFQSAWDDVRPELQRRGAVEAGEAGEAAWC